MSVVNFSKKLISNCNFLGGGLMGDESPQQDLTL